MKLASPRYMSLILKEVTGSRREVSAEQADTAAREHGFKNFADVLRSNKKRAIRSVIQTIKENYTSEKR